MINKRRITPPRETYCYKDVSSEEELKLRIAHDWFEKFSCDKREAGIDFWVLPKHKQLTLKGLTIEQPLLWAEAKKGTSHPIDDSFVQLILTIGKHRTNARFPAPAFLGAFDAEKMAFIRYDSVMEVFSQNDFNWNVTPSNKKTKEFIQLKKMVSSSLDRKLVFRYEDNAEELRSFIKKNIGAKDTDELRLIEVTPNNVVHIFNNWLKFVRDTIDVPSWEELRKSGITEADFFLAGLISNNNVYLDDKKDMQVRINGDSFDIVQATGTLGDLRATIGFKDGQRAQKKFWDMYRRPPTPLHCREILDRRDLLVPQDFRERKGAYFTPPIWVEKSQQYIADVLGEDWQDEYYVWDCCAGTGNLLNGLKNKDKIYASTLDDADVRIMKERIRNNGANMFEKHVFQFDFLNDDLNSEKVPKSLRDILNDEEQRKKLVIYINPPYAEAGDSKNYTGQGKNKIGVAVDSKFYQQSKKSIGLAGRELSALFLYRIFKEINGCKLFQFSKTKIIESPNFSKFRTEFTANTLGKGFIVPASSFDNVGGDFAIGFFGWDTEKNRNTNFVFVDKYNERGCLVEMQTIDFLQDNSHTLTDWMKGHRKPEGINIAYLYNAGNDVGHNNMVRIHTTKEELPSPRGSWITDKNLIYMTTAMAVKCVVKKDWGNDKEQYHPPMESYDSDNEFKADCLTFSLFSDQNRVSSGKGLNHWIPFTENEVDAKDCFSTRFMSNYIKKNVLVFSKEAKDVFDAGMELWKYYHSFNKVDVNASLFDIRVHFQGKNSKGSMENIGNCQDEKYVRLKTRLNESMKVLAKKIEAKVYEHGFLLRSDIETNEDNSA